jgi:hypothetical protein
MYCLDNVAGSDIKAKCRLFCFIFTEVHCTCRQRKQHRRSIQ